jgi:glycogen phosphorylase
MSLIAYFSMEMGLDPAIPTYSGGLGVLAGDTLRAAADRGIAMMGVSLMYRKGYFRQRLDVQGNQSEAPYEWSPGQLLERMETTASIVIEGRTVQIQAWRYEVHGVRGDVVPVYFLDTDLPQNDPGDRRLTDYLYGGDTRYRLCQEMILGVGGVAILKALGYAGIETYHMNEGHAALLAPALLDLSSGGPPSAVSSGNIERVRSQCVFTTHTPVPAGHDQFPVHLVRKVLGDSWTAALEAHGCVLEGTLNMTYLALFFSRYINGVSMRHEQVSQGMFPRYPINSITNGVHAVTWTAPAVQRLYDLHIPEWRRDNRYLRYVVGISLAEVQRAHGEAKRELLEQVASRTGVQLDATVMTLGFARRATLYKRPDLLFSDIGYLERIARQVGPLQIIYGGKAHPRDDGGKSMIRRVFQARETLRDTVKVVYLEEYDMTLGKYICSGVDLWLNTPQRPQEASGTSGMKAALNGVPSLSVLDGWWIEGHEEGITGWSIGEDWEHDGSSLKDSASLYNKLETIIVPMYYNQPLAWAKVMRSAIALNGSFFNAQRMVSQYVDNAYSFARPSPDHS